jgi:hypothetical protein
MIRADLSRAPLFARHRFARRPDPRRLPPPCGGEVVALLPGAPQGAWCSAGVLWWSPGLGLARPGAAVYSGVRRRGRHGRVGHLLPGMCFSFSFLPALPLLLLLLFV